MRFRYPIAAFAVFAAFAAPAPAQPTFREIAVHRTLTQGNFRVTLARVLINGAINRRTLTAEFRLTDTSGRPPVLARGLRLVLPALKAAGPALYEGMSPLDPASLFVPLTNLRDSALHGTQTLRLDVQAASLAPTWTWMNAPVSPVKGRPPALPVYRRQGLTARVTGVYQGTIAGNPQGIAVTVEETSATSAKHRGMLLLDAPGLVNMGSVTRGSGRRTTYEKSGMIRAGKMPARLAIRYYSSADVSRALRSLRFVFANVKLD